MSSDYTEESSGVQVGMFECTVHSLQNVGVYTHYDNEYTELTFEFENVLLENLDLSLCVLRPDGQVRFSLFQVTDVLFELLLATGPRD